MKALIRISILLFLIIQGCKKEDLIPPGEVTNLSADYSGTTIILTWSDPLDPDLDSIQIVFGKDSVKIGKGVQLREFTGLKYEKDYEFLLISYDISGNHSAGTRIQCRIEDLIPPAEVTNLSATYTQMSILLKWIPPKDKDFIKLEIAYEDTVMEMKKRDTMTWVRDVELEREYQFTIKTVDLNGNKSSGKHITCSTFDYRLPFTGTFRFFSDHWYSNAMEHINDHDTITYIGSVLICPLTDSLIQIRYREGPQTHLCNGDSVYGAFIEPNIDKIGLIKILGNVCFNHGAEGSFFHHDSLVFQIASGGHVSHGGLILTGVRVD